MITKCPCLHCSGPIEFEANDLAAENRTIPCPHCGQETSLFIPIHKQANEMVIRSKNDTLELAEDKIIIRRMGVENAPAPGLYGDWVIDIPNLTSIQMKPAGTMAGYILFSNADSKPFEGGITEAAHNPDAFFFGQELNEEIASFKWKVEQLIHEFQQHDSRKNSENTLVDELRSLAELKKQGLLTEEEFEAAKKKTSVLEKRNQRDVMDDG